MSATATTSAAGKDRSAGRCPRSVTTPHPIKPSCSGCIRSAMAACPIPGTSLLPRRGAIGHLLQQAVQTGPMILPAVTPLYIAPSLKRALEPPLLVGKESEDLPRKFLRIIRHPNASHFRLLQPLEGERSTHDRDAERHSFENLILDSPGYAKGSYHYPSPCKIGTNIGDRPGDGHLRLPPELPH